MGLVGGPLLMGDLGPGPPAPLNPALSQTYVSQCSTLVRTLL